MDFDFAEHHELLRQSRPRVRARRGRAERAALGQGGALPEGDRPASSPSMGLLGIRIPEEYGGSGHGHDELRHLRRGDRPRRRLARAHGRVAQRPRHGAHPRRSAARSRSGSYLPKAASGRVARGLGAHRAGERERLGGAARRRRAATATAGSSTARRCSSRRGASAASASSSPGPTPTAPKQQGHHRVRRRARDAGVHAPPSTSRSSAAARATRSELDVRGRAHPRRAARRRGRPRLHRHDADPRSRAHLDRRDGARPRLRRARDGRALRQGAASSSGKPIADFQAIQWMLADAKTELDAAALLTYRAAWLADQGEAPLAGGRDGQALRERSRDPRLQHAPSRSTAATATCASSTSSATCATRSSARSAKGPARSSAWSSPSTSSRADVPSGPRAGASR